MNIKVDSYVKYKVNGKVGFGKVRFKTGDIYVVQNDKGRTINLNVNNDFIEVIKPIIFDSEKIRKFVRCEDIDFSKNIMNYSIKRGTIRNFTIEDIYVGLENILKNFKHFNEWIEFVANDIYYDVYENFNDDFFLDDSPIINGFPTEDGVTNNILDYLYSNDVTKKDVENCMHRISIFLNNKDKEIENWELSTEEKESFIETWDNDMFDHAPDKVKNLVVKYVFELENCDSEVALKFLAYGYYCGNSIFPCDFFKSRDYLLRLMPHDKDGFYANTLGYIYYYGRCNNKVPEYDLAYKYYTLGHFHGVYESTYKLADMFLKGYGVNKDVKIAYNFVSSVYYDNIRKLRKDKAVKLADAALRMGTIVLKEELFGIVDYDRAYYYYLIANFAIELRKKQKDHVGDSKVDAAIKKCLEETYPKTSYKKSKKIKPNSLSQMLEPMMIEGDEIFASIENRGGKYFLTLRNNNKRGRMFVVIPEVGFCGRLDEIKFEIHNFDDSKISETGKYNFVFTEISNNTFFNNGDKDITIYCDYYTVVTNIKKSEKEYCIVSACYVPNGKVYDFLCDKMDYNVGDIVNVKEQSINCEVMITNISMRKKSELVFPLNMYKHIK